jgi:oxygen-independent coproporphyrinogen-3 oxidase
LPDEDTQAELYLACCDYLASKGYRQYEISNFSLPGFESQHNLTYWHCEEYLAIGPSAHGFTQGRRWHYPPDLNCFLQKLPPIDDGPGGDFESEGFSLPSARMIEQARNLPGYVEVNKSCMKLTREGFLLSNTVIGKLLF